MAAKKAVKTRPTDLAEPLAVLVSKLLPSAEKYALTLEGGAPSDIGQAYLDLSAAASAFDALAKRTRAARNNLEKGMTGFLLGRARDNGEKPTICLLGYHFTVSTLTPWGSDEPVELTKALVKAGHPEFAGKAKFGEIKKHYEVIANLPTILHALIQEREVNDLSVRKAA